MKRNWAVSLSIPLVLGLLPGCQFLSTYLETQSEEIKPYVELAKTGVDIGEARFLFDDFSGLSTDTLNTDAVPWKLLGTALVMAEAPALGLPVEQSSINPILQRFGFILPEKIGNWDPRLGPQPKFSRPVGMVHGTLERPLLPRIRLEISNNNCAACHSGVTYDSQGLPDPHTVWLGTPNTSLDLESYITVAYKALKSAMRDEAGFLARMKSVFPEMSPAEAKTVRKIVFPKFRKRLQALESTIDAFVPYTNGGPGLQNAVAAIKSQLGLMDASHFHADEAALVTVPDYGDLAFRSSITWDGAYGLKGKPRFKPMTAADATPEQVKSFSDIAAFFTVGAMGVSFDRAEQNLTRTKEAMGWVARYESPRFPGPIDPVKATRGREVFHAKCAKCHGTYSEGIDHVKLLSYPNRLVPNDVNDTDPTRNQAITPEIIAAAARTPFVKYTDIAASGGYVAPRLAGVWATAPYLHNGSVPTIWHLMHPESRPKRFQVGGHRLDYDRLGIAGETDAAGVYRYPEGYQPWSEPAMYDTSTPGRSNQGHEWQFDGISEPDRDSLREYLKLL